MTHHDAGHGPTDTSPAISGDEALGRLLEGNERFLRGESRFTGLRREMLDELAAGQQPFATILGCSDSRVPPELIFDAVIGELFVIRVAGNVLSPEVAGSLQYAGSHLRTPVFVVLGHEGCGAVQAAIASHHEGVRHRSHIQLLVDSIVPAIESVDADLPANRGALPGGGGQRPLDGSADRPDARGTRARCRRRNPARRRDLRPHIGARAPVGVKPGSALRQRATRGATCWQSEAYGLVAPAAAPASSRLSTVSGTCLTRNAGAW